jgi:alpha-D-ribose 1-methylphosphonate 5-triphosphate synthase subunit PhnL
MDLVAKGLRSIVLNNCHVRVSAGEIATLRGASGFGSQPRCVGDIRIRYRFQSVLHR